LTAILRFAVVVVGIRKLKRRELKNFVRSWRQKRKNSEVIFMKVDKYRYLFQENDVEIKAEKHTLIRLARALREAEVEGTLSDLAYQIEYEFDIDGIRSEDEEYVPSAENGDYGPSNPWDAPGMSVHDFIR
jgi:hypothetical protein